MKKQLLLLSSIALCTAAMAQLTATGINPAVGNVFNSTVTNYVSPGSAGTGQTWNLSSMTSSGSQTFNCVTPSSTANGSSFPTSNVCGNDGTNYSYYKTTSSAWQTVGIYAGGSGTSINYSDPEDMLHYPFSYTNTYTDNFQATFTSAGYPYLRKGTVTVTADGTGTLILPNGTYSNVTRVHFYEDYSDSTNFGGSFPYTIDYINDEYMWYLNGNHYPIAAVSTLTAAGSPSTFGFYQNTILVGLEEQSSKTASFDLFPSPASTVANLHVSSGEKIRTIEVADISGKTVLQANAADVQKSNDTYQLDVASLSSGVYFVKIINTEGIPGTRKLVITK